MNGQSLPQVVPTRERRPTLIAARDRALNIVSENQIEIL